MLGQFHPSGDMRVLPLCSNCGNNYLHFSWPKWTHRILQKLPVFKQFKAKCNNPMSISFSLLTLNLKFKLKLFRLEMQERTFPPQLFKVDVTVCRDYISVFWDVLPFSRCIMWFYFLLGLFVDQISNRNWFWLLWKFYSWLLVEGCCWVKMLTRLGYCVYSQDIIYTVIFLAYKLLCYHFLCK